MKEWVDRPEMGLLTAVVKSKDFMPTYLSLTEIFQEIAHIILMMIIIVQHLC